MGYSKSSGTTRGKMKWRAYVSIEGKQIVKPFSTKEGAMTWSKDAEKKTSHLKKSPGGYYEALRILGLSQPNKERFFMLNNCRLHLTSLPIRCRDYLKCEHHEECLDFVLGKGFDGWISVHDEGVSIEKERTVEKVAKKALLQKQKGRTLHKVRRTT